MTSTSVRRVQLICFALVHIPLAATVTVLAVDGLQGDLTPIAATFAATLVTALSLILYLGHALSLAQPAPREASAH